MKFGYFDDAQREYVITQPDTPLPWINYLGSTDYFGIISNTAGGYSFYRDARLRRLTRYRYNNVPLDTGGRYLYLRDRANGAIWSPSWQPVRRPLDAYTCRHGMGYTIISGTLDGIATETRYFVPLNENLEIWQLSITNQRSAAADLSIFSLVEFNLWDAYDDMTNYQRNFNIAEVEIEDGRSLDQTARHRRDMVGQREFFHRAELAHMREGLMERDEAPGDGGRAGAAVGLDDVAVDLDLALAEAVEPGDGA